MEFSAGRGEIHRALLDVITLIYRTVDDPAVWPQVFAALRELGVAHDVSRGLFWRRVLQHTVEDDTGPDAEGGPALASDGAPRTHPQDALAILEPHIARACRIRQQLEANQSAVAYTHTALEHADFGCIQIEPQRRVIWMNSAAREIVDAGRGLRVKNGELCACRREDQVSLERMLDDAFDPSKSASGDGAPPRLAATTSCSAAVRVHPARSARPMASSCPPEKAAFVVVVEATDVSIRTEDLCALYELTLSEATVAQRLALGDAPAEIAATLDRSVHTVRTHLKRIYAKTGTSRRPELVGRLLRGLARLRTSPQRRRNRPASEAQQAES